MTFSLSLLELVELLGTEALFCVAAPVYASLQVVVDDEAAPVARDLFVNREQLDIGAALWARLDIERDVVAQAE
jgi:hypothetical protein